MKKAVMILGVFALVLVLPLASFAETYVYVNTHGTLSTVVAPTAAAALKIPLDIDTHSGVLLLTASNNLGFRMQVTTATATVMVMPTGTTTIRVVSPVSMTSTSTMMNQGGQIATSSMMTASSTMSASSTASTTVR